jgi:hypothetical protein
VEALIERTRDLIERGSSVFPDALVCWSGGRDSMVLLHLLRDMGLRPRIVFFREPWQPRKYAFQDWLIREWELLVYTWHPYASAMQQEGGDFEIQNWYRFNDSVLTYPTGIVPPVEGLAWVCALDALNRPKQSALQIDRADAVWVGHKSCDSNPVLGRDAGTRVEARLMPGHASLLMPLRDWSDEDVWNYIESKGVPYDRNRYEKVNGQWRERPEQRSNADYAHVCTLCVDRREDAPKFVECPKLGMTIENVSSRVPWVEPEKLSYMQD